MYKKYMVQYKEWYTKIETWTEMNASIFNLVLQHCPEVLESLLKSQTRWDAVKKKMNGIKLLLMLSDITHKHNEYVQSTLVYIKTFLDWILTYQGKDQ